MWMTADDLKIKRKKHKQYKHLTIMLVPYTNKRVRSIKIPHWFGYAVGSIALVTVVVMSVSMIRADMLDRINASVKNELSKTLEENQQLAIRFDDASSDVISEREKYQQLMAEYETKSRLFADKAIELEEKIHELEALKNDMYAKINDANKKLGIDPNPSQNVGGVATDISSEYPIAEDIKNADGLMESVEALFSKYEDLSHQLTNESSSYTSLWENIKQLQPFLDSFPSIWPVDGIVTQEMGWRVNPFTQVGSEYHSGMDIAVPTGTEVIATGGGVVTFAGVNGGYGKLVRISHDYGLETYYAHNSALLVKTGDIVKRGDVIAKAGSTGRSTGPHVHYEVRLNGVQENPRGYFEEE